VKEENGLLKQPHGGWGEYSKNIKAKIMTKIAIPTDDGLIVNEKFKGARGFMVATIESEKIIHQEIRWNLLSQIMTSEHGSLYNLCDCDAVIVNQIGQCQCKTLEADNKIIFQTAETNINEAFKAYLDRS
jgi:predicted Fe-Mo cluster-binding NifX family protein